MLQQEFQGCFGPMHMQLQQLDEQHFTHKVCSRIINMTDVSTISVIHQLVKYTGNKRYMNSVSEQHRLMKCWSTIECKLHEQLTQGNQETIEALSKLFPKSKYPLPAKFAQHCVICHKSFEIKSAEQCAISHDSKQNITFGWGDESGSVWMTACNM